MEPGKVKTVMNNNTFYRELAGLSEEKRKAFEEASQLDDLNIELVCFYARLLTNLHKSKCKDVKKKNYIIKRFYNISDELNELDKMSQSSDSLSKILEDKTTKFIHKGQSKNSKQNNE